MRGGKSYKKGKKADQDGDDAEEKIIYLDKEPDQMVGRLMRLLGDLNTQVYCEDGIVRVCKICRAIKKKVRFKVGDVVLISLRDCEVANVDLKKGVRGSRGDILDRYHPAQYQQLLSEGISHVIFAAMETVDGVVTELNAGNKVDLKAIKKENDLFADDDSVSSAEMDDAAIDDI
jgi:initiation factor 1A